MGQCSAARSGIKLATHHRLCDIYVPMGVVAEGREISTLPTVLQEYSILHLYLQVLSYIAAKKKI